MPRSSDTAMRLRTLIMSAVAVWLAAIALLSWTFDPVAPTASFGDLFTAVNVLFSALALAGVLYTIILQREELALTREELRRAAAAQEAAADALRTQIQTQLNTSRLQAFASLLHHETEKINQVDRWNEKLGEKRYTVDMSRREKYEREIQSLLGSFTPPA